MKYALFLICALSALPPAKALAASSAWMAITGGKARLIIAEPVPGAGNTDALLQVDLNPGWKTYWRDPGDAGVPLQLDFSASRNAKLVDVLYPVPKRFDDGVTIWAGYDRPVAFGLTLERPDSAICRHRMPALTVSLQETAIRGIIRDFRGTPAPDI